MEANELMIGDWADFAPELGDQPIAKIITVNDLYMIDNGRMVVRPIPLTVEILEKNGFVKGDTMDLGDEIYCVKLFNIHYDNEERQFWVCNFFESEYGKEMMDIFRIDYVHELQHVLRLCKVDKEIVL